MKGYILVNTENGVVDGVTESLTVDGFIYSSKDEVLDYIYDEGLNPLTTIILEVTKVLEPHVDYKKLKEETFR